MRSLLTLIHNNNSYWLLVVCIAFAAGLWVGSPLRSSAETLAQYDRFLASASQTLDSALRTEKRSPGSADAAVESLYERTPPVMRVNMPDGTVVDADLSAVRGDLRSIQLSKPKGRAAKIEALADKLKAIRGVASRGKSISSVERKEASAKLKSELARSTYKNSEKKSLSQQINEYISHFLERLIGSAAAAGYIGPFLLVIIRILFIVILGYLLFCLYKYYSVRAPKRQNIIQQQIVKKAAPSLQSVLDSSRRFAADGEYREAYRHLYKAAILTLDKAKLITYADGVTNWEYLRFLNKQDAPRATEIFQDMTLSFDELIYGKRNVSLSQYQSCLGKYNTLEELLK